MYLWFPVRTERLPAPSGGRWTSLGLAAVAALAVYLWIRDAAVQTRIDNVSPVFSSDVVFGILMVLLLVEAVRRTVGWILVWVILGFLLYGAFGYLIPGAAPASADSVWRSTSKS